MYLYVKSITVKCICMYRNQSLKVNFKVNKFEVIRFPRLQSLRLFLCASDSDRGREEGCELWGAGG